MPSERFQNRIRSLEDALGRKAPYLRTTPSGLKSLNEEEKSVEAMISTPMPDRYGDIVEPLGMDNQWFRRNPRIPWNHDYQDLPIGSSAWERSDENGVTAKAIFHTDLSEKAAAVFRFMKAGALDAFSVGFLPVKGAWEEVVAENENGKAPTGGIRFKEWELLEYSPVVIPANPAALANSLDALLDAAHRAGMERREAPGLDMIARMMRAESLLREYPELLEPRGLLGLVERAVDERLSEMDDTLPQARAEVREGALRDAVLTQLRGINEALRTETPTTTP